MPSPSDILPPPRLHLPKLPSTPSIADQMLKSMSLWEMLLVQTTSKRVVKQILEPELRLWLDGRYGLDTWRLMEHLSLCSMAAWL